MDFHFMDNRLCQNGAPPFVTLAQNVNSFAVKINILDAKPHSFHESQPGTIHDFCHQGVGSLNVLEKTFNFFFTKHSR